MKPIAPDSSRPPEDVPTQPMPVVTDVYQPPSEDATQPQPLPPRIPPRPAPASLWPEFGLSGTPPPPPVRPHQRRPAPRALIVALVSVVGILLLVLLRVYLGGASAATGNAHAVTGGQQGAPSVASATVPATPAPTNTVVPTVTPVATTPLVPTTPPVVVVATRPPAPINTPTPKPPVVVPPPTAPTPKPPATPVVTQVGPTPPLTVRFTCGAAINHQLSHVCVTATPGATLSLSLYYRCNGQKALAGVAYLGASGTYTWDWTPNAPCTGTVLAIVNASQSGHGTSATASFPLS